MGPAALENYADVTLSSSQGGIAHCRGGGESHAPWLVTRGGETVTETEDKGTAPI